MPKFRSVAQFKKQQERRAEERVKVTVVFEMPKSTAKFFLESSIERVINTSMSLVADQFEKHADSTINFEDWNEWKPVVCDMWSAMHNRIWIALFGHAYPDSKETEEQVFQLRKGNPW